MTQLIVSEIFGPTFQGEGPSTGRLCAFLRLGGCNLTCSWCDTKYTWDASQFDLSSELEALSITEVISRFDQISPSVQMLVITGGEPMLQQTGIVTVLRTMGRMEWARIEIETNGTIPPSKELLFFENVFFNISPKLANSDIPFGKRIKSDVLRAFLREVGRQRTTFKFVASSVDDLKEVSEIVAEVGISPRQVWIMPEGITSDSVIETGRILSEEVLKLGWNLTTRLQVLLWPGQRER